MATKNDVKAETSKNAEKDVKAETSENVEKDVKVEISKNAEKDVKAETSENVEKDVKVETSKNAEKDVKAETSENLEKDVKVETAESSKNVEKVNKADETVADDDETSNKEEEVVVQGEEPVVVKKRKVVLKSNDNKTFEVDEEVAMLSETIKHMLEDDVERGIIPIPNVRSDILNVVIEYCRYKVKEDKEAYINYEPKWEKKYFMKMDNNTAIGVALAANYLNIKCLLDLCCQSIADTIKDMSVEEVSKYMNIKNDLTPEEEAKIRKEHEWAHEI